MKTQTRNGAAIEAILEAMRLANLNALRALAAVEVR